jgi:hypothetical protein
MALHGLRALDPGARVLVVSGALGLGVGLAWADWQVCVETAQVLAGLVRYPPDNPFFIYHVKLWTLLHQVCALLLKAGLSEMTVSILISGLMGMLSLQALALVVYALSRSVALAIGAACLIVFTGAADHGVMYPVMLFGTSHTYGAIGLSYVVLVVGLLGSGWTRSAAFLLGLAPAVHPSLGLWLGLLLAVVVLWDYRRARVELRPALPHLAAGAVLTAASLAVQLGMRPELPSLEPGEARRYLSAFVGFWDWHRQPVYIHRIGVRFNLGAMALALIWLRWFAADLPRPATWLLRFVAVSAALSVGLVFVSWLPPDSVPITLLVLMPSRLLNINAMIAVAVLFGLLGAYRSGAASHVVTALLSLGLLLGDSSALWGFLPGGPWVVWRRYIDPLQVVGIAAVALIVVAVSPAADAARSGQRAAGEPGSRGARGRLASARIVSGSLLGSAAILLLLLGWQRASNLGWASFGDAAERALFETAAAGEGLLLTGGDLHLIQLRTRRPVLIDGGGLDALPYSLEAAPEMERILREVYGIDLFHPPREARGGGRVPQSANRQVWERYSLEQWREIRRRYHVTQVLSNADWRLDLPPLALSRWLKLNEIPE